jgi:peptidoglycan/xylan/chitin deacetylase (PgdA/CDA1 family)
MTGIVTLSMEIELAWGVHDKPTAPHLSTDGSVERAYLQRLLGCCDDHEVPITFDVVGHLLESACSGTHDGPHEEGWFENDPGTDADRDPLFYAPDIVPEIDARPTAHELCTHTYSHVLCGAASTETVAWELETAQRDLEALIGGRPRSFVPPRHSRPPTPVLQETGIEIMRMSVDTTGDGRLARLQELVIGPHPDFGPATMEDVVETYCTSYPSLTAPTLPSGQRQPAWPFSAVPVRVRQRLQKLYLGRVLDRTAANDGQCHLWCHLYDLSNQYQWPVIEWFLEELAARREQGTLQVMTMASLNDHVRSGVGAGGGRGSGGEESDRPVLE